MLSPDVLEKTETEVLLRNFEFGSRLASTETISTVASTTVQPSGELTATAPAISGSQVQYTVSSGIAGREYLITCQITTSLSQTLDLTGKMRVKAL